MKIIHVAHTAERYGIGTFLIDLIECQKECFDNLQVGVIFHTDGPCIDKYKHLGIPVYSLGLNTAKDIRAFFKFYKIFKDYDIVNLHSYSPCAFFAAVFTGKKIVYSFHGAFGFKRRWTDIFLRIYYRIVFNKYCRKITFASKTSLSRYNNIIGCRISNEKAAVFPYGLSIEKVVPSKKREQVRTELGVTNYFVVGTAARMDPIKRIERLVDASSMIQKKAGFRLLIMGAGDETYQKHLVNQVRDYRMESCVRFMGYRSDVLDIVNALDLFVLPSNHEAFGLALLEAMILGIPSVVFEDGGGLVDILGKSGFIVKNPKELRDVILNLTNDANLGKSVSKKVEERAMLFDIKYTADHLYSIYTSLCET